MTLKKSSCHLRHLCHGIKEMLYLSPKYLMLQVFPWKSDYYIASVEISMDMFDLVRTHNWNQRTPMLLWVPAVTLGVSSYLGWIATKTAEKGVELAKSQTETLEGLQRENIRLLGEPAQIAYKLGQRIAQDGKPACQSWLPRPDPVHLDPAFATDWDGKEKWISELKRQPATPGTSIPDVKPQAPLAQAHKPQQTLFNDQPTPPRFTRMSGIIPPTDAKQIAVLRKLPAVLVIGLDKEAKLTFSGFGNTPEVQDALRKLADVISVGMADGTIQVPDVLSKI